MTQYLISFDDGTMIIPEEDLPAVVEASLKVVQEARDAGVWVFGGGVLPQRASIVSTDGTVLDRRCTLTRGRAGVGCPDRHCLPVCTRGTGDRD